MIRKGTVDAVMPDGSILWVSAEGASLRRMISRQDGYEVFTHFLPPKEHLNSANSNPGNSCKYVARTTNAAVPTAPA